MGTCQAAEEYKGHRRPLPSTGADLGSPDYSRECGLGGGSNRGPGVLGVDRMGFGGQTEQRAREQKEAYSQEPGLTPAADQGPESHEDVQVPGKQCGWVVTLTMTLFVYHPQEHHNSSLK